MPVVERCTAVSPEDTGQNHDKSTVNTLGNLSKLRTGDVIL
jgi:hypothetical protein